MSKFVDITGNKYGELVVLELTAPKESPIKWVCKCSCGTIKSIVGSSLKRGTSKSCGCIRTKKTVERSTTHGATKNNYKIRLYRIWRGMKIRCEYPRAINYADYGGRGIKICDDWQIFNEFKTWALLNGYYDTLEIDRIDSNSNYSPNNCRWVSRTINTRNRRSAKGSTSKYVGVHFHKGVNKWVARLTLSKERIHLGNFNTELEAAQVRDAYIKHNKLEGFTINLSNYIQKETTQG